MSTTTLREELTVPEVARRLRRHPATIRQYIHDGRLPAHRLGGQQFRVYASDLERLTGPVEAHSVEDAEHAEDTPVASLDEALSRLVSTWPRLSDERRAALGVLLSTP